MLHTFIAAWACYIISHTYAAADKPRMSASYLLGANILAIIWIGLIIWKAVKS